MNKQALSSFTMRTINFFTNNRYLVAIKDAFVVNMPLIIAGSFATLINSVLCSTTTGLAQLESFRFLADYSTIFSAINYAAINFMAISICFLIASFLADHYKLDAKLAAIVAVASYIVVIPTTTSTTINEVLVNISNVITNTRTNAQGLFLAMIIAILSVEILRWLMTIKALKIKMPESVPSGIAKTFESLAPTVLTLFIVSVISFTFIKLTGSNLADAIFNVIQTPLQGVMQFPLGILLIILVSQILWVFGLHGANITSAIREPLMVAAIATNMAAVASGEAAALIVAKPFWTVFCTIGGSGSTLGLLIAIFLVSKREDYKTIGKLSALPAIFNINEPLIFGLPIVLNPIIAIPFVVAPLVTAGVGYFATYIGFAGVVIADIPWNTPPLINAFIATGGSVGAVITQAICLTLSVLIYLPFVKKANTVSA